MKILFIGCVQTSYVFLKHILENKLNVCGIVTKEKSLFNSDFSDLSILAIKNDIPYIYCDNVNDDNVIDFISNLCPDVIYCFGWSQILKSEIISLSPKGVIGFHPAKLPSNRGRHPIIWALALGLDETSSTFFIINEGTDTGDIISQESIIIDYKDNAEVLIKKIENIAKHQIIDFTHKLESNTLKAVKQIGTGNEWRKRNKLDGKIDFRMSSENIYNLVRALYFPYVCAHFEYKNRDYKVFKCEIIKDYKNEFKNIEYGKIIEVYNINSFLVKTGDHLLKIIDCQDIKLNAGDYL